MNKISSDWVRFFQQIIPFFCLLSSSTTLAQVVPDISLPINSNVTKQGNTSIITGGTTSGRNLFHSFSKFSVPTNGTAYFNNALDIQNIISRVTGSSISNIDGLIRANGAANLFLINSNGIIFGLNAKLNIGGSFLGTTANSINFADGTQFSASTPQTTPLLTINIPVGLSFGSNPGSIRVIGNGYSQANLNPTFSPFPILTAEGLRVHPGKSLALVGGDISLEGGILTTPGGRIELGSANSGLVSLSSTSSGWILGYQGISSFKDIHLSQQALINVSGDRGGNIQIFAKRLTLTDGSVALIQNKGIQTGGSINVNASEFFEVSGTSPDARVPTGLFNETVGRGNGGNIDVSTKQLNIQGGGKIVTRTFSTGTGGNITVTAPDFIQITGFSPIKPTIVSIINTTAYYSSGQGGDVTVSTGRLTASNGGGISSVAFGSGNGGNVIVNAADSIELNGVNPVNDAPSVLGASTFTSGNAGNLTINTSKLMVMNGATTDASAFASGDAGSVTINAKDSVEVSGKASGFINPSLVDSSVNIPDPIVQQLLKLPPVPSGTAKNVTINTKTLSVTNNGLITVKNDGPNSAGTLKINADSIFLDNKGGITAATASGQGGNVFLNAQNLQLRDSSISATVTSGNGNGGNVTINTNTLLAIQNSKVTARANNGNGGHITVKTQGLITDQGFFSSSNKPSDISKIFDASSNFGINGTFQVNIFPEVNIARASANPTPVLQSPEVSSICASKKDTANSFISTGSGGNPPNPNETISSDNGWQHNTLSMQNQEKAKLKKQTSVEDELLIPATGVEFSPDGKMMRFISDSPEDISSGSEAGCSEANLPKK